MKSWVNVWQNIHFYFWPEGNLFQWKSIITLGHYDTVAGLSTTLRFGKWWPISMNFYDG